MARPDGEAGRSSAQAEDFAEAASFARRIVHDFNNILGSALGNLELAQVAVGEKSDAAAFLAKVERALGRGVELTGKLTLFAADLPGALTVARPAAAIGELRGSLAALLPPGTVLDLALAEGGGEVEMNLDDFEAVLVELVKNASDAMAAEGSLTIGCETRMLGDSDLLRPRQLPPGPYVVVTVTDNGAGMAQDVRARAFEPFFSTRDRKDRRGLGLSIVHGFAVRHRGWADIASTPGGGTCVSLFLPSKSGGQGGGSAG